jgi:hypothetical protein
MENISESITSFNLLISSLGRPARRSLKQLGVDDLFSLTSLRFVNFLRLKKPPLGSWDDISSARFKAIQFLGGLTLEKEEKKIKDPKTIPLEPPTRSTLFVLPLFSSLEPELFGNPQFHPLWHSDWKISDLAFQNYGSPLWKKAMVETVGQLLLSQGEKLLMTKGIGECTLKNVYDVVSYVLLGELEACQGRTDYTSFKEMLDSWISLTIKPIISGYIVRRHFIVVNDKFPTHKHIGREFGLSSSRIGQILRRARKYLSRKQSLFVLDRFWREVKLQLQNGQNHLTHVSQSISKTFNWADPPSIIALSELLSMNPEIEVDFNQNLVHLK